MTVLFGGSRTLPPPALPAIRYLVSLFAPGCSSFVVGDALGADSAFLSSLVLSGCAGRGRVFLVGAASAFSARACGAALSPWAGGPPVVPFRARLARRSEAAVRVASSGWWVLSSPAPRSGSLLAASLLALRGGSVSVVCAGFCPSLLPPLPCLSRGSAVPAGAWVVAPSVAGLPCRVWAPVCLL